MNLIRVGNRIINMDQVSLIEYLDKIEGVSGNSYVAEIVRITTQTDVYIRLTGLEARTFWKFLQNKLVEVKV